MLPPPGPSTVHCDDVAARYCISAAKSIAGQCKIEPRKLSGYIRRRRLRRAEKQPKRLSVSPLVQAPLPDGELLASGLAVTITLGGYQPFQRGTALLASLPRSEEGLRMLSFGGGAGRWRPHEVVDC